jgi:hypothetical protein
VRLEDTDLLESLDNVPLHTGRRVTVVAGAGAASLLGTVQLGKGTDTDVLAEVDVAGDSGCRGQRGL